MKPIIYITIFLTILLALLAIAASHALEQDYMAYHFDQLTIEEQINYE